MAQELRVYVKAGTGVNDWKFKVEKSQLAEASQPLLSEPGFRPGCRPSLPLHNSELFSKIIPLIARWPVSSSATNQTICDYYCNCGLSA